MWRAGEERPLGELELDRVGEGVVAKLAADPGLPQKRQFCRNFHNGEVAVKLLPLVVVVVLGIFCEAVNLFGVRTLPRSSCR